MPLLLIELDGSQNPFKPFTHALQLRRSHVADAADIAAAKVIDHQVETIARAVVGGGIDLIARLHADAAVLVIAVCEGDSGDGCRRWVRALRCSLTGAIGIVQMRSGAGVEVRSTKGGQRKRIEGDVND